MTSCSCGNPHSFEALTRELIVIQEGVTKLNQVAVPVHWQWAREHVMANVQIEQVSKSPIRWQVPRELVVVQDQPLYNVRKN
jgi:hypothetical protein